MTIGSHAFAGTPVADANSTVLVPKRPPPKRTVVVYRDRPVSPEAR